MTMDENETPQKEAHRHSHVDSFTLKIRLANDDSDKKWKKHSNNYWYEEKKSCKTKTMAEAMYFL